MNPSKNSGPLSATNMSRQQLSLMKELFQAVPSMHRIDDLFQWLAHALIQCLNIQVLLFWTNQINQTGQLVPQLRTIARQDPSFPKQIVANSQVQCIAQRLMSEQIAYEPQPLETLFSSYQTALFKRYGLPYWGTCFTSAHALLPPQTNTMVQGEPPAFFAMTTMLFLQQRPQFSPVQTTSLILEEATKLAIRQRLLLPTTDPQMFLQPDFSEFPRGELVRPLPEAPLTLAQLIPSRVQDADLLLASNPFARPVTISDKKARQLHRAIDGRATVAELCSITGLTMQEISVALQLLSKQRHIEVREPNGKPVKLSYFIKGR